MFLSLTQSVLRLSHGRSGSPIGRRFQSHSGESGAGIVYYDRNGKRDGLLTFVDLSIDSRF